MKLSQAAPPTNNADQQRQKGRPVPRREDIVLLAAYNASMNRKLYAAAAKLPHTELCADRGAFFGSLFGTLNHIIAADTLWLHRFMGHPSRFHALQPLRDMPKPASLTQQFGADLPSLLEHRTRLDEIITALAAELSDADLNQVLSYQNSRGTFRKHFGSLVLHFFNHQTHHRGQASTLLSQAGIDIGVTDLLELISD
jgi:uncharacterized damage-inducible protein DinB